VDKSDSQYKTSRESTERLLSVLKGANLGTWDWDLLSGDVVYNERWATMLDYTLEEVQSYPNAWEELIHPDDLPVATEALQAHLEGRTPMYQAEYRLRTKSGGWRWILDTGQVVVRDEQGNPLRAAGIHQDITESKKVQEELRRAEAEKESILDSQIEHVIYQDRGMHILWPNQAACDSVSMSREALIGRHCYKIWAERDAPCEDCPVVAAMESGEPKEVEKTTPDGRSWYIRGYPVLDADHEIIGAIEVTQEITARKQAERELRESEQFLHNIFEGMQDGLSILDRDLTILRVNQWMEKMYADRAPLVGKKCYRVYQKKAGPCTSCPSLKAIETGERQSGIVPFPSEKDPTGWIELAAFPLRDTDGQVTGVIEYVRDISEQVRAERLLNTLNRAALALAQARTPDKIFAAVAEELRELGFFCMILPMDADRSRLYTRYLNYEGKRLEIAEKLVGAPHKEFSFAVESSDSFREIVWEKKTIFAERMASERIMRQVFPHLSSIPVGQIVRMMDLPTSIGAPLIVEDEVIGVLLVQSDDLSEADVPAITAFAHQVAAAWRKAQLVQDLQTSLDELKETQDRLLQGQKMQAIGRLAGGVAHDFNNILTAIKGYTQLLQRDLSSDDPATWPELGKVRADLEEIRRSADRAAALTQQLLAFSRRQVLQPIVLNLNGLLRDMGAMLQRLIGEDIELIIMDSPTLGHVRADPGQIEQVILNLSVNGRDAMPQGGQLTFETANVELDEAYAQMHPAIRPGEYVMLAVSDTGTGMTEEVKKHVFEPFYTTKEQGEGTGLGLATVYGVVEQSGGHIEVYSEVGAGTTFKIYLPRLAEPAPLRDPIVSQESMPQGSETILLVEDEQAVRNLIYLVLERCGYRVLKAEHPQRALDLSDAYKGSIHLLVTDVVMPGIGGKALAERLASSHPETKVLYMSGYTDDAIVHHGVLDADLDFLQKPFTPEKLARKVREILDRT
jgi:PAS domain S-box-containing protein